MIGHAAYGASTPAWYATFLVVYVTVQTMCGQMLHELRDHPGWIRAITLTPSGSKIISASYDGLFARFRWVRQR